MLQPVSTWLKRRGAVRLDEIDIRQLIERYVRAQVASVAVYCAQARDGRVVVRVPSALLRHEVLLLEYDLGVLLQREADFALGELTVTQS